MESLEFVSLATSKDEARFNLTSVYRDKEHLVACDGHRLHYSNGLPAIEKGHYLNGQDAEFPNYRAVIPTNAPQYSLTLRIEPSDVAKLKGLLAMLKTKCKVDQICRVEFLEDGNFKLSADGEGFGGYVILTGIDRDRRESLVCPDGINLAYLMDVFVPTSKIKLCPLVTVEYHGKGAPFVFDITNPAISLGKAVIMPCRL